MDPLIRESLALLPTDRPTAAAVLATLAELAERAGCAREPEPPAAEAHAEDPAHMGRLAHSLGRKGAVFDQRRLLLAAVAHAPLPDLWLGLGSTLHRQGYDGLALRAYAAAEALSNRIHHVAGAPMHVLLPFHRANAYSRLGQHEEALHEYRKILEHHRAHVPALWGASNVLARSAASASATPIQRRERLDEARQMISVAAELEHDNPHVRELQQRIERAHALAHGAELAPFRSEPHAAPDR
jgi:tetratricopeptide (TPR) repeat protein